MASCCLGQVPMNHRHSQFRRFDVLLSLTKLNVHQLHHFTSVDHLNTLQNVVEPCGTQRNSIAVVQPDNTLNDVVYPASWVTNLLTLHELQQTVGNVAGTG